MLVLLPPSETKRDGGEPGSSLDLAGLSYPELATHRTETLDALRKLSRNLSVATGALGLGPTQRFEVDRNRVVLSSPVMPVIDRYTGVLFDGIAAETLGDSERQWVLEHVAVNSALFGLVGAGDRIPAYRLSHDSRLPGLSLKKHWRQAIGGLIAREPGLVLDLRSESYASLGPAPESATYIRVVSEGARGRRVALSHFNKKGKGEFTRAVIAAGIEHASVDELVAWAAGEGIRLEAGAPGELDLVL